jgi:hypothetical protein
MVAALAAILAFIVGALAGTVFTIYVLARYNIRQAQKRKTATPSKADIAEATAKLRKYTDMLRATQTKTSNVDLQN